MTDRRCVLTIILINNKRLLGMDLNKDNGVNGPIYIYIKAKTKKEDMKMRKNNLGHIWEIKEILLSLILISCFSMIHATYRVIHTAI